MSRPDEERAEGAARDEQSPRLRKQTSITIVVTCARGTEKALEFELKALDIMETKRIPGAVLARGNAADVGRINVFSRIGHKVLIEKASFTARNEDELRDGLAGLPYETWIAKKCTYAGYVTLREAPIDNTLYGAQLVGDAVRDRFRELSREAPMVDKKTPAVRLVLHWDVDHVTLSLDSTGKNLSHRGYRPSNVRAPMRESLAAAVLAIGFADTKRPFVDPCCGSGTLAIEQAWRSMDRAPGIERRFAIDRWPGDAMGFFEGLQRAREEARDRVKQTPMAPIYLSDWHREAVRFAEESIHAAGLADVLAVERIDARRRSYDMERPVVVSNLPFGERLGGKGDTERGEPRLAPTLQLDGFYRTLGEQLGALDGARVLFLTKYPEAERLLNLGKPKRTALYSGPMKVMLRRWDTPRH